MHAEKFSAGQAVKVCGLTYRQVDHWARHGVVVPSGDEGCGHDGVRAYSFRDLVALKVVANLRTLGLSLRQMTAVAHVVQSSKKKALSGYLVGSANGQIAICEETAFLSEMGSAGRKGLTWFLNVTDITAEVREAADNTARINRGKALRVA